MLLLQYRGGVARCITVCARSRLPAFDRQPSGCGIYPIIPSLQTSMLFSDSYSEGSPQKFLVIGLSCRGFKIRGLGPRDGVIVDELSLPISKRVSLSLPPEPLEIQALNRFTRSDLFGSLKLIMKK